MSGPLMVFLDDLMLLPSLSSTPHAHVVRLPEDWGPCQVMISPENLVLMRPRLPRSISLKDVGCWLNQEISLSVVFLVNSRNSAESVELTQLAQHSWRKGIRGV